MSRLTRLSWMMVLTLASLPAWAAEKPAPAAKPAPAGADAGAAAPAPATAPKTAAEATAALQAQIAKLRQDFEASADVTAAKASRKSAETAYETARKAVLERLAANPEYKAAKAKADAAKAKLDALRANTSSTSDDLEKMAKDVYDLGEIPGKIEADALAADAQARAARDEQLAAGKKLQQLTADFNAKLQQVPEVVAAKKAVEDLQAKEAAAAKAKAPPPSKATAKATKRH